MKNLFFTWTDKKVEKSKLKGEVDAKIILDPDFSLGDLEIPEPEKKKESDKPKVIKKEIKGGLF